VDKSDHTLIVFNGLEEIARYKVSFGRLAGSGPKRRKGDRKTPEGPYTISERKANSQFHLALRLSYPNPEDVKYAESKGWHPGGDIMIHGGTGTKLYRRGDWTLGCIAVTNSEIEEIWRLVPVGTPVNIVP
jgi:murein L,D-transpeptidase YafK